MSHLAAIDIGTNSIHMIIGKINKKNQITILEKRKQSIMLGSFLNENNHLTEIGITTAIQTLKDMKKIAAPYSPHYLIVATHIARISENFLDFQKKVTLETGLNIRFIDGKEEARLSALGIQSKMGIKHEKFLGIDIGGGSTEIFIFQDTTCHYSESLNLGAVLLSEKFKRDPGVKELEKHIKNKIDLIPLPKIDWDQSIGCSGTIKTLFKIYNHKRTSQNDETHEIPLYEIESIYHEMIKARTPKSIEEIFEIDAPRSESILFGTRILIQILKKFHIPSLKVCHAGIREGLLLDHANKNEKTNISIKSLQEKFNVNIKKASHIEYFAMQIFHSFHKNIQISQFESVLRKSCKLYSIGKFIHRKNHGEHGSYIVRHIESTALNNIEKIYVASILKHQSRTFFSEDFHLKTDQDRNIARLTSILKVSKNLAQKISHDDVIHVIKEKHCLVIQNQSKNEKFYIEVNNTTKLVSLRFTSDEKS